MKIDTKTNRESLAIRREPYFVKLQRGAYLGFRRTVSGGTWVARWRTEDGKHTYNALKLPMTTPAEAYDEAQKLARAWFVEKDAGVTGRWTVEDAATHYIADRRLKKGNKAANDAKGRIDRCILPTLGKRHLDRLRTSEIEVWLNGLVPANVDGEQARRKKASANRDLTTLRALLNKAWRSGHVASSDAWKKVEAFTGTHNARKIFLTPKHRHSLLEHTNGAFRDLVEAALLTGARYGELRSLFAGDYDNARRILSIREGKTGPRDVPVSEAAATLFVRLKKNKLPSANLFTHGDGVAWSSFDQERPMRAAAIAAKLPKGTVFYVLRHTFIAAALTGGMGIHQVAKLCGTSVRMIELHYDKFLHSDAQEKLNQIAFV